MAARRARGRAIWRRPGWRADARQRRAWQAGTAARRLLSWLSNGPLLFEEGPVALHAALYKSLLWQGRRLSRRAWALPAGPDRITGAAALCLLGLVVPERQRWIMQGYELVNREIGLQILADGGHVSRSPAAHLSILFDLLTLHGALQALGRPGPIALRGALDRMLPMVRFFRHGDGRLALFNGGGEAAREMSEAALAHDDGHGRPFGFAPHSGYQRLAAGRSLVLVDAGRAPPAPFSATAHAGCLALEMSAGPCRMIVNCGSGPGLSPAWREAARRTAAHSTLSLGERSSAEFIRPGFWRRRDRRRLAGPGRIETRRKESKAGIWLDAGHNGYARPFGLEHHRRLFLSAAGEALHGEDRLVPARQRWFKARTPISFSLRFHLHPDVRAGLVQGGAGLLVRLANGDGWRFMARIGDQRAQIAAEAGVYLGGRDGTPRRTTQIVLRGVSGPQGARVNWLWRRIGAGRGKGAA